MSSYGDACDTLLVLGLAYDGSSHFPKHRQRSRNEVKAATADQSEPSLTLGLVEAASEEQSAGSSFSTVKEEMEVERVSPKRRSGDDVEEEGGGRKKLRLTKEQSALLEERFREQSTLNPKQKMALARQLNLRPRQVEVWFQNRRARTKLKQTEVDCEFLKRCCETLTDENRRLHRELQELRAVKFASAPLFMQLPTAAAAATMCPSCERITADGSKPVAAKKTHLYQPFTRPSSAAC